MKITNKQEEKFESPELTLYQKVALRGEVSLAYETSMHEEDTELNSYILIYSASSTPQYIPFFREEMLKYIDEETFNRAYRYVAQEMFPKTLAIRKIIADLRMYIGVDECVKDRMPKIPKPILKNKYAK